jgi:hypothetical protein
MDGDLSCTRVLDTVPKPRGRNQRDRLNRKVKNSSARAAIGLNEAQVSQRQSRHKKLMGPIFGAEGHLAELSNSTPVDDGPHQERHTITVTVHPLSDKGCHGQAVLA